MPRLLIAIVFATVIVKSKAQNRMNCDSIYSRHEVVQSDAFILYESMPEIIGGFEHFYKLAEERFSGSAKGRVIVRFIVDTLGNVKCAGVIKSDNENENTQAVKFIEGIKFLPATQRGEPVMFVMTLPITFGNHPSDNKSNRRK